MTTLNINLPPEYRLTWRHSHSGNSSRTERHGHKYMTTAKILDRKTGKILVRTTAYCSRKDTPSREIGRTLAIARAMEQFYKGEYLEMPSM